MTCTVAGRWVEGVHGFGRSDGSARSGTVVGTAAADAGAAPAGHSHRFEPGITVRHGEVAALGVSTAVRGAAPGSGSDGDRHRAVVTLPAGARLCPGFVDHHLHLLAMAAARCSIDLSDAASLTEVFNRISAAAGDDPHRGALAAAGTAAAAGAVGTGAWLRGWGIDEADLAEGRLPTAAELDALGPHRPLVLHHRTGHSRILNRAARANGGHAPPLPEEQLVEALRQISDELCAAGVVAVTDATHTNDRAGIELLAGLLDRAGFVPRVTAMVGADRTDGCRFGETVGAVTVGHAKIMPPSCGLDAVAGLVARAHRCGFPVATHVIDIDELQAALDAGVGIDQIDQVGRWDHPDHQDRLEHLGLCLPEQLQQLAARRLSVVTQPTFVTRRAGKYRRALSPVELGWLYPLQDLLAAGVAVRGSSDAPVVPIGPLEQVAAAVGRTLDEEIGHRSQRIGLEAALELVTRPLAMADPADFVVLSHDPASLATEALAGLEVLATVQGGVVVHGALPGWPAR